MKYLANFEDKNNSKRNLIAGAGALASLGVGGYLLTRKGKTNNIDTSFTPTPTRNPKNYSISKKTKLLKGNNRGKLIDEIQQNREKQIPSQKKYSELSEQYEYPILREQVRQRKKQKLDELQNLSDDALPNRREKSFIENIKNEDYNYYDKPRPGNPWAGEPLREISASASRENDQNFRKNPWKGFYDEYRRRLQPDRTFEWQWGLENYDRLGIRSDKSKPFKNLYLTERQRSAALKKQGLENERTPLDFKNYSKLDNIYFKEQNCIGYMANFKKEQNKDKLNAIQKGALAGGTFGLVNANRNLSSSPIMRSKKTIKGKLGLALGSLATGAGIYGGIGAGIGYGIRKRNGN